MINNNIVEDLVESKKNELLVADFRRMMLRMFNKLKMNMQKQFNEYQANTDKKFKKTQKQFNEL
jgi:molybdenum-dependent DNA-binding transcriptional regulator ModE